MRGDSAPSREAGQSVAGTVTACLGEGVSGQSANAGLLQLTFNRQSSAQYDDDDIASTVSARDFKCPSDLIAFNYNAQFCDVYNYRIDGDVAATLNAQSGAPNHSGPRLLLPMQVRRLTPIECERLQGFPDNWTLVGNAADGPRYKALGNSMAVPVINWIGRSIEAASWGVWA